jgi:hypothetical protein
MRQASLDGARALLVAGVLTISLSCPGLAQDPRDEHALSDAEVEAFAKGYVELGKILYFYESRLDQAWTVEEGRAIYTEALSAMLRALNDQGLNESRYIEIFEIARTDDTLLEKIVQLINEEEKKE